MAAVRAATDSASLALQAVEASVQHFVETRDYMRLKDMAEASAVAGQVCIHPPTSSAVCLSGDLRKTAPHHMHCCLQDHR